MVALCTASQSTPEHDGHLLHPLLLPPDAHQVLAGPPQPPPRLGATRRGMVQPPPPAVSEVRPAVPGLDVLEGAVDGGLRALRRRAEEGGDDGTEDEVDEAVAVEVAGEGGVDHAWKGTVENEKVAS